MTNLIISRTCNQSCSYCFAAKDPASHQPEYMSLESFENCLDFLDRSGVNQARFLGGEPTLHPMFGEFVRLARERDKMIVVFTNGLMPQTALDVLDALPPEQCSIVMNVSAMGQNGKTTAASDRRIEVLYRLGHKVQPGCNIYQANIGLAHLFDLIVDTGCKRAVRIGLAQPILGGKNVFLPVRSYLQSGEHILQFAEQAAKVGIKIEFDCGFVRCMFSDAAAARMEELGADLGWRCSPIIDIDTDGSAFYCFPLSGKYITQLDFSSESKMTAANLREMFDTQTAPYRQAGIYKECVTCLYKHNQICSGGCLANIINRFSDDPIHLSIPE